MATVPSYRTWVAGEVATAAFFNSNVRDAGNYWLTNKPVCQARQTSPQSIPNIALTSTTYDTNDYDDDGMHSTSVNPTRFTCVTAGRYLVIGEVSFAQNSSGFRGGKLQITRAATGTTIIGTSAVVPVSTASVETAFVISATEYLNVNDYITFDVYQSSGGSLNTGSPFFGQGWNCRMQLIWIHNA